MDVILTNPPFGGTEEPGIEANFPADIRTKETADLFLVLIKHILRQNGRAALVLPDGTLAFTVADAAYPAARVDQIIRTLDPAFVLLCGDASVDLKHEATVIRIPELPDDALQAFVGDRPNLPDVDPDRPAYITFTSGSTGEPKGVVTHHAPLVHFIQWHARLHGFTQDDCFSLLSGLGHDPVYRDVFTPLSIGAKVVCPAQSTVIDPAALATWIQDNRISVIHLTPPLGKLIETGAKLAGLTLDALRYFFWGGDALSKALYQQIRLIAPGAVSVNFYGTTETPQAMGFHRIDPSASDDKIPLGRGIDDAFGGLDILVHCAGIIHEAPLLQTPVADFDREKGTITMVIQALGKTTLDQEFDATLGLFGFSRLRTEAIDIAL